MVLAAAVYGGAFDSHDPFDAVFRDGEVSTAAAEDVAYEYFERFDAGDVAGVVALFGRNATFAVASESDQSFTMSLAEGEERLAWNLAQGTRMRLVNCEGDTDQTTADQAVVTCRHTTVDALAKASAAPGVPTLTTISMTPLGIERLAEEYGQPDFLLTRDWFLRWVVDNHRDGIGAIEDGSWSNLREATENGARRQQYAQEWGQHLYDNGCFFRFADHSYTCVFNGADAP